MAQKVQFTQSDGERLVDALSNAEADKAFLQLADYLERNELQLSDATLRRYVISELFACFSGRRAAFDAIFRSS